MRGIVKAKVLVKQIIGKYLIVFELLIREVLLTLANQGLQRHDWHLIFNQCLVPTKRMEATLIKRGPAWQTDIVGALLHGL